MTNPGLLATADQIPEDELPIETPPYYLSPAELATWHLPESIQPTDPKLQTSMRAEKVPEKEVYLREQLGLTLPTEWYDEVSPGNIRPDFLACIHVAYTFASNLPILRTIQQINDPNVVQLLLHPINAWMDDHIERRYGWRRWIPKLGMNAEGFFRRQHAVRNTNQLVSEEEMLQIVTLFREKYQQR